MDFLAETDQSFAEAKTLMLRCEILCKRIRSRCFVTAEGSSVEARKAAAEIHMDVIGADDNYIASTLEYEGLKAKRSRAEILIEVWRSINASQRKS